MVGYHHNSGFLPKAIEEVADWVLKERKEKLKKEIADIESKLKKQSHEES